VNKESTQQEGANIIRAHNWNWNVRGMKGSVERNWDIQFLSKGREEGFPEK
jgi:hypothetical protein